MLRRKNKKGIMLAETVLKIIIAALCIAVLVILAAKLFGIFSSENKVRKAEDNLNLIAEKIAFLTSPDYTKDFLYVTLYSVTGWFMKNFEKNEGFPEKQCVGRFESCLCICKEAGCGGLKACKGFENYIIIDSEHKETSSEVGGITTVVETELLYEGVLKFESSIEELNISKEGEIIKISKSDRA